ncbi:hypothetical protein [Streptomyces erythrochromogenes]|uniref:hypothetical protein n=1 Tax=Streptomyces erythrochromogenes TaxID=285574 RepID=UPI0036B7F331
MAVAQHTLVPVSRDAGDVLRKLAAARVHLRETATAFCALAAASRPAGQPAAADVVARALDAVARVDEATVVLTGEAEKAARRGLAETARESLQRTVRTAAAQAHDDTDFLDRLRDAGLRVRECLGDDGALVGYSVALPGDRADRGSRPVWFGGSTLAHDLSLPRVRERFTPPKVVLGDWALAATRIREASAFRWAALRHCPAEPTETPGRRRQRAVTARVDGALCSSPRFLRRPRGGRAEKAADRSIWGCMTRPRRRAWPHEPSEAGGGRSSGQPWPA